MSQLSDIKRIIKLARKKSKEIETIIGPTIPSTKVWEPSTFTKPVKEAYIKRRPWLSLGDATNTLLDAEKLGYILLGSEDMGKDGQPLVLQTIQVTTKGRKLAECSLFIFPTGMWLSWYNTDGKLFVALATALIALLTVLVGFLAKIALLNKI